VSGVSFESARLALSRITIDSDEAYRRAVRQATEVSATALGVERVGVWYLRGDRLEASHLYTLSTNTHSQPDMAIDLAGAPGYAAALRERRVIVADDVATDPVVGALSPYCGPLGITSLLDAPFYFHGRLGGVICHEHVGPARRWSEAELSLACTVADMAAVICGQAELLHAQQQLRDLSSRRVDTARVDTLAQLAAAVAHEVGNLLTVVQLGVTKMAASTDPEVAELAPSVSHALDLAASLFDGMRRFGRARAGGAHTTLNGVLGQLTPLLELLVKNVAKLDVAAGADAKVAMSDGDLQQVIINLVTNARDAIDLEERPSSRRGTIRITARAATDHAEIEISDDGPGVSPDLREAIFDPYVTSKTKGTGLGLSLVRQMVEEVGGAVRLQPGARGATFVVELPVVPT
jgi:signal transduction histidine kinase